MQSVCLPGPHANSLPLMHLFPRTRLSLSDHVGSEKYSSSLFSFTGCTCRLNVAVWRRSDSYTNACIHFRTHVSVDLFLYLSVDLFLYLTATGRSQLAETGDAGESVLYRLTKDQKYRDSGCQIVCVFIYLCIYFSVEISLFDSRWTLTTC